MTNVFDANAAPTQSPYAQPLPPLEYFDAPDEGWVAATRLVLAFTAVQAGARVFSGVVMYMIGGYPARFPVWTTALMMCGQAVLPLAMLVSSLAALSARSNAARLALVWCAGVWIAGSLILPVFSVLQMVAALPSSMSPVARAGYYLSTLISAVGGAVMPAMTIVLLTRAPVRRLFGASL